MLNFGINHHDNEHHAVCVMRLVIIVLNETFSKTLFVSQKIRCEVRLERIAHQNNT
jgi:hypothetical protein